MESVNIILNQLVLLGILLGIGFSFRKIKLFDEKNTHGIAKLVVNLLLPMLIFELVAESGVQPSAYLDMMMYAVGVALIYTFMYFLGTYLGKLLGLSGKRLDVFILFMMFGNTNFFGVPLILSLFNNPTASLNLSQQMIVDNLFLWSIGLNLCKRHLGISDLRSQIRAMANPTTIALVLGILSLTTGIHLSGQLQNAVLGLADSTKYLSMIYLGSLLAGLNVGPIIKEKSIYALIVVKMVLLPILFFMVFKLFFPIQSAQTVATMFALPGMVTVSILVAMHDSDATYAAGIVFITTLLCLVTLPLVTFVFTLLS